LSEPTGVVGGDTDHEITGSGSRPDVGASRYDGNATSPVGPIDHRRNVMALTERSRAALYRGLSDLLDDEEAVGEMLSNFAARDVDEPASRDFVDARIANVEARVAEVRGEVAGLEQRLTTALHAEMRTMTQWTIGSMVAFVGVLVAVGLIR